MLIEKPLNASGIQARCRDGSQDHDPLTVAGSAFGTLSPRELLISGVAVGTRSAGPRPRSRPLAPKLSEPSPNMPGVGTRPGMIASQSRVDAG